MRIGGTRSTLAGGVRRIEADIAWEDAVRPPSRIFFEISGSLAADASPDANAFLAGAAIPAMLAGERRIAIDGEICPRLRDGIAAVEGFFRSWNVRRPPLVLEPDGGFRPPWPADTPRAALLLSGGLDSLFTLQENRRRLPIGHPSSFRDAVRVRHLMFPVDSSPERRAHIEKRSENAVARIASESRLGVTAVSTNVTQLHDDFETYMRFSHGSVLACIGLTLAGSATEVTISASHDLATGLRSWGSHPLLDPQWSTAAVAIRHEGIAASRLAKAAAIAPWNTALASLYVCESGPFAGDDVNCGRCEKCVRTRIDLLLAGGIEFSPTFPREPVLPSMISGMPGIPGFRILGYYWRELAAAARRKGRPDLAAAIEARIEGADAAREWQADVGWKGALRRVDRRFFGGILLGARRRFFGL